MRVLIRCAGDEPRVALLEKVAHGQVVVTAEVARLPVTFPAHDVFRFSEVAWGAISAAYSARSADALAQAWARAEPLDGYNSEGK